VQRFGREEIRQHCVGQRWPEWLGRVTLGEPFILETERFNNANGPILVEDVRTGDDLAIHVEAIDIEGPFEANNGGPLIAGPAPSLEYRDGWFIWPRHFRLPAGLPSETSRCFQSRAMRFWSWPATSCCRNGASHINEVGGGWSTTRAASIATRTARFSRLVLSST
jgi:hypothetical protein